MIILLIAVSLSIFSHFCKNAVYGLLTSVTAIILIFSTMTINELMWMVPLYVIAMIIAVIIGTKRRKNDHT